MQSNEKRPSAEALAAVAPVVEEVQPVAKDEDVEVTLKHSSWGSHSFRAPEAKVAHSIPAQLTLAKKAAEVRAKVEAIDKAQDEVHAEIARVRARVAAAEVLGDAVAKGKHQADVEDLQKRVSELSAERAKVLNAG